MFRHADLSLKETSLSLHKTRHGVQCGVYNKLVATHYLHPQTGEKKRFQGGCRWALLSQILCLTTFPIIGAFIPQGPPDPDSAANMPWWLVFFLLGLIVGCIVGVVVLNFLDLRQNKLSRAYNRVDSFTCKRCRRAWTTTQEPLQRTVS